MYNLWLIQVSLLLTKVWIHYAPPMADSTKSVTDKKMKTLRITYY